MMAMVLVIILPDFFSRQELSENSDYRQQLEQLNQVESNISEFLAFIEEQKVELKDAEETIAALESEQQTLEPIVQSNRDVVEALFQVQEERTKANVWRERGIGFILGTFASLVASLLWSAGQIALGSSKKSEESESQ